MYFVEMLSEINLWFAKRLTLYQRVLDTLTAPRRRLLKKKMREETKNNNKRESASYTIFFFASNVLQHFEKRIQSPRHLHCRPSTSNRDDSKILSSGKELVLSFEGLSFIAQNK